ncbi:hypothetical protein EX30DRAFT_355836 [Ascodesmis nigricans]|uniref:Uncharacterized protein n=1 Tax=Ascodesmis nigricans TaxID=341454 RepID=A0A4S2MSN2_9PEZI|nr:hypothetical protein EX30DRAFT_355836 [Ascodesmis nigricans]
MPALLLPATASPFAARGKPNVVLKNKVDPWLTANLKRINRIKRPLNSVPQHMKCLTETLAQPSAIWNLCTMMIEKAPTAQLDSSETHHPVSEALMACKLLHIRAYVVAVDLVLTNEISFKLAADTIDELITYHRHVYLENEKAKTWQWSEKDAQCKKLQDQFVQAVNKFVYRADQYALEGLEDDGAGELLNGKSEEVKTQIRGLFTPLLPPPPPPQRMFDVVRPPPQILPSNMPSQENAWWSASHSHSSPSQSPQHYSVSPPPVDAWKILPSSPIEDPIHHSPSPPPALHHHHHQHHHQIRYPSTTSSTSSFWSTTSTISDLAITATTAAAGGGGGYAATAPIPHLPLPKADVSGFWDDHLTTQAGSGVVAVSVVAEASFGGFGG